MDRSAWIGTVEDDEWIIKIRKAHHTIYNFLSDHEWHNARGEHGGPVPTKETWDALVQLWDAATL